ncbi:YvrJ protein family protein [Domibacillus enclensis]|uniref:YvrJ protein family protein n=2 Tax=Domibacillus enclensis TaxID=1017273 RepID=A0A1N7C0V2_9BACI|nr:YvrJ protein family protein [Domibacillus enclensis]
MKPPFFMNRKEGARMDWMSMISDVGFPIIVTFYLLNRIETKVDQLTQSINDLAMSFK